MVLMANGIKIIIGLGNPGDKYDGTRHNLGFEVVDAFAKKHLGSKIVWEMEDKFKSEILRVAQNDNNGAILIKPQTYMNNSGMAVSQIVHYLKIPTEKLIVVHDDIDLPLGKIKIRLGGSAAGHHGVESIIKCLNDDKFIRLRLGIGNIKTQNAEHDGSHSNVNDFVTSRFLSSEKPKVKHMLKQSLKALELLIEKGLTDAQNQFN